MADLDDVRFDAKALSDRPLVDVQARCRLCGVRFTAYTERLDAGLSALDEGKFVHGQRPKVKHDCALGEGYIGIADLIGYVPKRKEQPE